MVVFSILYLVAIFILGDDVFHRQVIQEILAIMNEYNLKVWFVWISREGMLSYNNVIGARSNADR